MDRAQLKNAGNVNSNSLKAIYIELMFNEECLGKGTGFCCESNKGNVLITNLHNVTGVNPHTKKIISKSGGVPNKIKIYGRVYSESDTDGEIIISPYSIPYTIDLYSDVESFLDPRWIEHPVLKKQVDVVGLLLPTFDDWSPLPVHIRLDWYTWEVANRLNIIGYPFGKNVSGFAIWTTGYFACDPDIDYEGLPAFLVDARTRPGQSGSLVISEFRVGEPVMYKGKYYIPKVAQTYFHGIYSGRINEESDIGIVWKASVVCEIIDFIDQI